MKIQWEKIKYDGETYYEAVLPFLPTWDVEEHGDAALRISKNPDTGCWYFYQDIDDRLPDPTEKEYPTFRKAASAAEKWLSIWCPRLFGNVVVRRLKNGGFEFGENWDTLEGELTKRQALTLAHWILSESKKM